MSGLVRSRRIMPAIPPRGGGVAGTRRQIGAGGEDACSAGQDPAPQVWVIVEFVERSIEPCRDRGIDRVALFLPREGDDLNLAPALDVDAVPGSHEHLFTDADDPNRHPPAQGSIGAPHGDLEFVGRTKSL
jgi:hypothetical protein